MTPEQWTEIKKISTGLGRQGLLVGIIHELIAEVERLLAELAERERPATVTARRKWPGER